MIQTEAQYWEMDIVAVETACEMAGFTQMEADLIWEPTVDAFGFRRKQK